MVFSPSNVYFFLSNRHVNFLWNSLLHMTQLMRDLPWRKLLHLLNMIGLSPIVCSLCSSCSINGLLLYYVLSNIQNVSIGTLSQKKQFMFSFGAAFMGMLPAFSALSHFFAYEFICCYYMDPPFEGFLYSVVLNIIM